MIPCEHLTDVWYKSKFANLLQQHVFLTSNHSIQSVKHDFCNKTCVQNTIKVKSDIFQLKKNRGKKSKTKGLKKHHICFVLTFVYNSLNVTLMES